MNSITIQIAGITISLSGEEECLRHLGKYYDALLVSDPSTDIQYHLIWRGARCVWSSPGSSRSGAVMVGLEEHRPAVTNMLVLRILQETRPELVFLHGNVLWNESRGSAVLLLGDSGAGKSTLTHLLLERDTWSLMAEDLVILDTSAREVLPFPRTSLLRVSERRPSSSDLWRGLGRSGTRQLKMAERRRMQRESLDDAQIVLLKKGEDSVRKGNSSKGIRVWALTFLGKGLENLRAAFPELTGSENYRGYVALDFEGLDDAGIERLSAFLESTDNMILRMDLAGEESTRQLPFPPHPELHACSLSEAVTEAIGHRRGHRGATDSAGRVFMRLAETLSGARGAYRLWPGGSPEETAELLGSALKGSV